MEIQYKKIIKDIMDNDAKEHGYKMTSLKSGFIKWDIASFDKYEDEYNCHYGITLNMINEGEITLNAGGVKVVRNFTDEVDFRNVIAEYAEFMRNEGFMIIDNNKNKPRFKGEDNEYLYNNYMTLSERFYDSHDISNNMSVAERISCVLESIEKCRCISFADTKEELLQISAFYVASLLMIENTRFVFEDEKFAKVYKGDSVCTVPLKDVISVWLNEKSFNIIKSVCEDFLTREELSKIEWN